MAFDWNDCNYKRLSAELLPNLVKFISCFMTTELKLPLLNNGRGLIFYLSRFQFMLSVIIGV